MGNDSSKEEKEALSRERRGSERQARREARMAARPDRSRAQYKSLPVPSRTGSGRGHQSTGRADSNAPPQSSRPQPASSTASNATIASSSQSNVQAGHYASQSEKAMLMKLRDGYKKAALHHKLNGDREAAIKMIRVAKQLDIVIQAISENKPIDLRGLPPAAPNVIRKGTAAAAAAKVNAAPEAIAVANVPPATIPILQVNDDDETTDAAPTRKRLNPEDYTRAQETSESNRLVDELSVTRSSRSRDPSPSPSASSSVSQNVSPDDVARLFNAPTSANSILDALTQRIDKYKATEESAKSEGNASKARRLGRIVKQYEAAIDAHTKHKPFDYDTLPTPPGFPPIPFDLPSEPRRIKARAPDVPPVPGTQPVTSPAVASVQAVPSNYRPKTELNAKVDSLNQLQVTLKKAALEHKRTGEVQEAIEYLKLAKGFDPIIEAVKSGLPIDESSIPQIPEEILEKLQQLNL